MARLVISSRDPGVFDDLFSMIKTTSDNESNCRPLI